MGPKNSLNLLKITAEVHGDLDVMKFGYLMEKMFAKNKYKSLIRLIILIIFPKDSLSFKINAPYKCQIIFWIFFPITYTEVLVKTAY